MQMYQETNENEQKKQKHNDNLNYNELVKITYRIYAK